MLVSKAIHWGRRNLREAGIESADLDCELLLARSLGTSRYHLVNQSDRRLSAKEKLRFTRAVRSREKRVPLPYLTREKEFFGRSFVVWPGVFVPRPESELIIEIALSILNPQTPLQVADICSGSGCLGITFAAEFLKAQVVANDLSSLALRTSNINATRNRVETRYTCLQSDLLSSYRGPFDVVLLNPPYGNSQGVAQEIDPEVTYEPGRAVWAGPDGLLYYRQALADLARVIKPGGIALLEFDPPQADSLVQLAQRHLKSSEISIHKDLSQKPRVLKIKV